MFIYATEALILEFLLHKKDAGLWCIDTVLAEISAMTKIAIGSVNWKFYCRKYYWSRLIDIGGILL